LNTNKRILSVDIFRGLTIALMILVNNPGTWNHIYAPFRHAAWHGCTPTDLVFPFFLFIVGTSIVLAYASKKKNINSKVYYKILIRSAKLIALGLFLAGFLLTFPFFKSFSELRLPGVLQRIGLVFFFAALLFLHTNWKVLLGVFFFILVGYWLLMTQIPIQGSLPLLTKESNLAAYLDLKILTQAHIWKPEYDPEGLLSTLPAIATAIMGMFLGFLLKMKEVTNKKKLIYMFLIGGISLLLGSIWGVYFPINKALWTSSYVLYSGGWAFVVYAFIFYLTEIKGITKWGTAFVYYGSNAITVFFLSGFIAKSFYRIKLPNNNSLHSYLYNNLFHSWISIPELSSLLYAFCVIGFYYLLARFLYKKGIFIKV
jgi:predicted acyltransferase